VGRNREWIDRAPIVCTDDTDLDTIGLDPGQLRPPTRQTLEFFYECWPKGNIFRSLGVSMSSPDFLISWGGAVAEHESGMSAHPRLDFLEAVSLVLEGANLSCKICGPVGIDVAGGALVATTNAPGQDPELLPQSEVARLDRLVHPHSVCHSHDLVTAVKNVGFWFVWT